MLEFNGYLCIDTIGILYGSNIPITIVFLVADESINSAIICSASTSSLTLLNARGVKVDSGLPLLWCP